MEKTLSQFETFSHRHDIDNPEIIVKENEIFIDSEIFNFDISSALIASILCIGLISISENGFGYLLFAFAMIFCYIIWSKLKYVNTSHINLTKNQILIRPKLIHREYKISFREISQFHVKYIETSPRFRNYKVHITTADKNEVKLIDFDNEDAAKDFVRLMNMHAKQ